jgi:hypothetical protein
MAAKFKYYQQLIRVLKTECPPAYPVSVRRVKLSQLDGLCWKHGKQFYIQINRKLDESRAMDVLIHEWAHARAWNHRLDAADTDEAFNKLSHDAAWGVAYSEVYVIYEKIFTHPPVA